jgi:hypothetical protein
MSIHHKDVPFPVYDYEYWWSDEWDPTEYGQEFDFGKPFFEQYEKLMNRVPHIDLQNADNENAYYTSYAGWNKNCYWIFFSDHNQDCCYLEDSFTNQDCMDCSYTHRCTLCYEAFFCTDCYNCRFAQGCNNCADSWFLKNCIGCKHCFGCVNLRNKECHFFNEKCSRQEYGKKLQALDLKTPQGIADLRKKFQEHVVRLPHRYREGVHNESVSGDYINHSKNVRNGYIVEHCQDCAYINDCQKCINCYDMDGWGGTGAQLVYEGQCVGEGVHSVAFSNYTFTDASNIYYSDLCINGCHDVFGCFGLRRKKYCVLNKAYARDEYERLIPKIIEHMQKTKEWGEFFPIAMSPYGYNETMAQQYFPLTKEEVLARGYAWKEEKEKEFEGTHTDLSQIPQHIEGVDDSICDYILTCEASGKPYKIQKLELKFYRTTGIPIPHLHPDERYRRRLALRNPRKLWNRTCAKCKKDIQTSYAPDRPETIYCEECYLKEVE